MCVVEIASVRSEDVIALGAELRRHFQQEGVGYVVDGVYGRILEERP